MKIIKMFKTYECRRAFIIGINHAVNEDDDTFYRVAWSESEAYVCIRMLRILNNN